MKVIGDDDHMQTPSMVGKGHINTLAYASFNACRSCLQVSTTIIDRLYWTQVRKSAVYPIVFAST